MATSEVSTKQNIGKVTQVIGSTFDAEFPEESLPEIYNALILEIEIKGLQIKVTGEVQQHLGGGRSDLAIAQRHVVLADGPQGNPRQ